MSKGTAEALKLDSHRIKHIKSLEQFEIGNFSILPFMIEHDAAEPLRFFNTVQANAEKSYYMLLIHIILNTNLKS